MNNIERDLRRRLKKSIKKRTELNERWIKYKDIVDKAISKLETYANNSKDNCDAYAICVDLLDTLRGGKKNGVVDKNAR